MFLHSCVYGRIVCAVTHITLTDAMARKKVTQQQLENASGVDRTWIARLKLDPDANPTIETYDKLDAGLRALGVLKRGEKLVFSQREAVA